MRRSRQAQTPKPPFFAEKKEEKKNTISPATLSSVRLLGRRGRRVVDVPGLLDGDAAGRVGLGLGAADGLVVPAGAGLDAGGGGGVGREGDELGGADALLGVAAVEQGAQHGHAAQRDAHGRLNEAQQHHGQRVVGRVRRVVVYEHVEADGADDAGAAWVVGVRVSEWMRVACGGWGTTYTTPRLKAPKRASFRGRLISRLYRCGIGRRSTIKSVVRLMEAVEIHSAEMSPQ